MRRIHSFLLAIFILLTIFASNGYAATSTSTPAAISQPVATEMPLETKRAIRKEMLAQLMVKYNENHLFTKINEYMVEKYRQLKHTDAPRSADVLLSETMEKSRNLFDKVKGFVGNDFKNQYDPEHIEASANKYLWLKGVCFFVLGIGEEHKLAVSFFYVPGNEKYKQEFLRDTVKYSFPNVNDIPENAAWFDSMSGVMDRLGYKIFNVDKYITPKGSK